MGFTGEESSASLLRIFWGRIFCFLTRDCFNVLESIGEESSTSSMGMVLDTIEEESSTSLMGMMFDRVFCSLTKDDVFDALESLKMVLDVLNPLGMVFDVLDQGKRLLLPLQLTKESFDNSVP
nr:hypothetical protein CFP56_54127 [Quercus suber]